MILSTYINLPQDLDIVIVLRIDACCVNKTKLRVSVELAMIWSDRKAIKWSADGSSGSSCSWAICAWARSCSIGSSAKKRSFSTLWTSSNGSSSKVRLTLQVLILSYCSWLGTCHLADASNVNLALFDCHFWRQEIPSRL